MRFWQWRQHWNRFLQKPAIDIFRFKKKKANKLNKKIVLTGGGTAGHVTPNIALIPFLKEQGYEIFYIGSYDGIEKKLIADYDITYYGIATGKFRRYLESL